MKGYFRVYETENSYYDLELILKGLDSKVGFGG